MADKLLIPLLTKYLYHQTPSGIRKYIPTTKLKMRYLVKSMHTYQKFVVASYKVGKQGTLIRQFENKDLLRKTITRTMKEKN